MSLRTARELWGEEVVQLALDEAFPEGVSAELVAEVKRRADPPGAFRAWALSLPWPQFCAVVRIVSGEYRSEVMEDGNDARQGDLLARN